VAVAKPNPYIAHAEAWVKHLEDGSGKERSHEEYVKWKQGPDVDWSDYSPQDFAAWWLNDDYSLSGHGCNSEDKAAIIYHLCRDDSYDFMRLVKMNWSSCDDFYDLTPHFYNMFNDYYAAGGKIEDAIPDEDKEWWASLPNTLTIYRGCSRERIGGLSWTLDRKVAEQFARGHRNKKVEDPVIAETKVEKRWVWFATNAREEQEIVFCPLQDVKVTDFNAQATTMKAKLI